MIYYFYKVETIFDIVGSGDGLMVFEVFRDHVVKQFSKKILKKNQKNLKKDLTKSKKYAILL